MACILIRGCAREWPPADSAPASTPRAEAPASGDFLARARQHIAEREYWASENAEGLQAQNRAQGLRTYFTPAGIRVVDRTAPGSPELLALRWSGVGRGAQVGPVASGEVASEDARVEIRRDTAVEWYVNGPEGLEQGFTLERRPHGAHRGRTPYEALREKLQ